MRAPLSRSLVSLASLVFASTASAATLTVGPGKSYPTPCAAIAAASAGDTVAVSPGASAYTDTCAIATAGLTVLGVGGQPKIDLSATQTLAERKGIYVIDADGVTLENLELTGANLSDDDGSNGAAIRDEASGLVVRNCFIHDNQDGILATPGASGSTLTVEYTQFDHNALGDGCGTSGCTHNIYVGSANMETFVFAFNWSHDIASGASSGTGHLLKTRALNNYILYNALLGEKGQDSYELDVPQGGLAVIVGNVIQKPAATGNPISLSYGEEGLLNTSSDIFVASNTFASDYASSTTFIHVASGGTLAAHDNLFSGSGPPSDTGALSGDNLQPPTPLFVSPSTYDYHLQAGSPAIGRGVPAGAADGFSLTPVYEYVQPTESVARAAGSALDVGAFEFGTRVTAPGQTASVSVTDGGVPELPDAGGATSDSGAATRDASGSRGSGDSGPTKAPAGTASGSRASGGCRLGASDPPSSGPWLAFGCVLGMLSRRRRRAASS